MKEKIYTIPVNEAFDDKSGKCPFCLLHDMLQENQLTSILGASMMEPEIRIQTNEKGFCKEHFSMLRDRNNRLGLALILESHLDTVKKEIKLGGLLARDKTASPKAAIQKLEESCYLCDRIEDEFSIMFGTAVMLYEREKEFREKLANQKCFCLPHYRRLLEASARMSKQPRADLVSDAAKVMDNYLEKLRKDISWFCQKFDYRNENEPWYDSKDAIERAISFLSTQ